MVPSVLTSSTSTHTVSVSFISGTLYEGPPAGATDWDPSEDYSIWTAYRVFQTPDGRIYLNGSGNSYAGGMSGFTETQTYSYTMDGETMQEDKLTVKVYIKSVPRLEKVIVTQYESASPFRLLFFADCQRDRRPQPRVIQQD